MKKTQMMQKPKLCSVTDDIKAYTSRKVMKKITDSLSAHIQIYINKYYLLV